MFARGWKVGWEVFDLHEIFRWKFGRHVETTVIVIQRVTLVKFI
jgi:hypothetical protein